MRAAEHKSGDPHLSASHSNFSISQLWLICGGLSLLAVAILWTFDLGREPATLLVSLEKARK